jgi:DNA-binding XRE family transcriptional regulator
LCDSGSGIFESGSQHFKSGSPNARTEAVLTLDYTPRIVGFVRGKELKALRQRLGLTQAELAEKVGVAPNSIARQERDEIGIREPLARLIQLLALTATKPKKRGGR